MDIPKLTDIVTSLGAEGLKRIQLSGVDLHTIGCMEALGQITPACSEFRMKLAKGRKEQRLERWWILDSLVQFGSGTNTVVDRFLKTRAGKNVLALLTALSSILESGAVETLSILFQKLRIPEASTPGLTQLQNLRSTCLPLVRKMDFKYLVAQMHQWLGQEFCPRSIYFNSLGAMPASSSIADLMKELHQIVLHAHSQNQMLVYFGMCGAAWLVVYSSQFLGLSVCLVHEDDTPHPVQGTYESASVIVLPESCGTSLTLRSLSRPTDIIRCSPAGSQQKSLAFNWLLSCDADGVDYLKLICGWNISDRQELGDLVYSIAKEYVECRVFLGGLPEPTGLIPYYGLRFGDILTNLKETLRVIGFTNNLHFKARWREEYFRPAPGQALNLELIMEMFSTMSPFTEAYSRRTHRSQDLQPKGLGTLPGYCVRCHLYNMVLKTAYQAYILALTDWSRYYKKISLSTEELSSECFECFLWIYSHRSSSLGQEVLERPQLPERLILTLDVLARKLLSICTGSRIRWDHLTSSPKPYLGADFDDMLLIDYRAIELSIESGPMFIIRDGEFSFCGERRPMVTEPAFYLKGYPTRSAWHSIWATEDKVELPPFNDFHSPSLEVGASLLRDSICLNYTFLGGNDNYG